MKGLFQIIGFGKVVGPRNADFVDGRVKQHGGAEAVFVLFALENREVDATFAPFPEGFVVGQFAEDHGSVSEFVVDLHDGETGGQSEEFCPRELDQREEEGFGFNSFGQPQLAEFRIDNESGVRYVGAMPPAFDVAESSPASVFVESHDSFTFTHFRRYVLGCTFGDAGTASFGGLGHLGANFLSEFCMLFGCNEDIKIIDCHLVCKIYMESICYLSGGKRECVSVLFGMTGHNESVPLSYRRPRTRGRAGTWQGNYRRRRRESAEVFTIVLSIRFSE